MLVLCLHVCMQVHVEARGRNGVSFSVVLHPMKNMGFETWVFTKPGVH